MSKILNRILWKFWNSWNKSVKQIEVMDGYTYKYGINFTSSIQNLHYEQSQRGSRFKPQGNTQKGDIKLQKDSSLAIIQLVERVSSFTNDVCHTQVCIELFIPPKRAHLHLSN